MVIVEMYQIPVFVMKVGEESYVMNWFASELQDNQQPIFLKVDQCQPHEIFSRGPTASKL